MPFDRRQRQVVVEVFVVASLMLAMLGLGYLVLAAAPEEDRLVTKGIQQIVICEGPRKSGDIWYKITDEIPGAESGEWGFEKDGDCRVMSHYADTGPAD
jgi:hypothetical protein